MQAAVGIGVGVPMLLTAALLSFFATAASAHVSSIDISCTGVQFSYDDFPTGTTATSHEVVSIDGVEVAERDFTFVGPSASDTILISVGFGTHSVEADDDVDVQQPAAQGSASDHQRAVVLLVDVDDDRAGHDEHLIPPSRDLHLDTVPHSTTSTTKPHTTTSSAPETTTSVPTTATTAPESTTTTVEVTTTTKPPGSTTTTEHGTTSTSTPVHNLGSTTTTTPVQPHGSTVPPGATSTAEPARRQPAVHRIRSRLPDRRAVRRRRGTVGARTHIPAQEPRSIRSVVGGG